MTDLSMSKEKKKRSSWRLTASPSLLSIRQTNIRRGKHLLEQERYRDFAPLYLIRQKIARAIDVHTRPLACFRRMLPSIQQNLITKSYTVLVLRLGISDQHGAGIFHPSFHGFLTQPSFCASYALLIIKSRLRCIVRPATSALHPLPTASTLDVFLQVGGHGLAKLSQPHEIARP